MLKNKAYFAESDESSKNRDESRRSNGATRKGSSSRSLIDFSLDKKWLINKVKCSPTRRLHIYNMRSLWGPLGSVSIIGCRANITDL